MGFSIYGQYKPGEIILHNKANFLQHLIVTEKNVTSIKSDRFFLPAACSQSMDTATLISNVHWLCPVHFPPSLLGLWYPPICYDCLWTFPVKISRTAISLHNNVLLATGPQSCMATSCTQESWLCLITTEIMRVGKGFVLPLRTPIAADRAAGIFSCCPCWCADRRAQRAAPTWAKLWQLNFFLL